MTDGSSFQDLGDGRFRVSGARISPTTGRYITTCKRCDGEGWVKRGAPFGPIQCTDCNGKGTR